VTGRFIVGLTAAILGAALLLGDSLQISPANFRGDLLGLVSAVWYGSYQLTAKHARRRFATPILMATVAASAAIALFITARLTGEPLLWESDAPWRGWTVLLSLALVSHVCGQGFIVYALAHLPAGFASTSLLVQPLVAAIAAWLLLGEGIGYWQFVGGTVILLGIYVVQRATFRGRNGRN
jgi:drug/metabolite transporter (DMT)-like permease